MGLVDYRFPSVRSLFQAGLGRLSQLGSENHSQLLKLAAKNIGISSSQSHLFTFLRNQIVFCGIFQTDGE